MPRRNKILTDSTTLLVKIKNQPPNTSHRQLAEITECQNLQLHALYNSFIHLLTFHKIHTRFSQPIDIEIIKQQQ
jgi:hypothetical protein